MREYPVTVDELLGLAGVGVISTISFSIGGTYLNRAWDIQKDLELSQQLPERIVGKWEARAEDSLWFGVALIVIGVFTLLGGGAAVFRIIKSTSHRDE